MRQHPLRKEENNQTSFFHIPKDKIPFESRDKLEQVQNVSRVNDIGILCSVLPSTLIAEETSGSMAKSIYITTSSRISACVLAVCMLFFASISLFVNLVEKNYSLSLSVALVILISLFALIWLKNKKRNPVVPQLALGFTLTALSIFILISGGPTDGSSMTWVAVMPLTTVLCMGVLFGAISFALLYSLMLALFFTPLGSIMAVPLTNSMEIRLLLVSLATFCFGWFLEYARFKTNLALHAAAYKIEQSSLTDSLTGLGNRRDFDRSFKWTMARAGRSNSLYSLAILDIDHFKRVNDTYGHAVGDEVLKHIAREVETQIRNADRIFRWGGEEFTIIMPSTSMNKAVASAERVRKHIESTPFVLGNEKIFLTVSLGLYSGSESKDISYPLNIADQCLYRAKSTGRNKVVGGI